MKTYCRICEAACGLVAEPSPQGAPLKLRPDPAHPVSQGFVCAKGTRFPEVARHASRLLQPMQRQPNGALSPISWDAALALCSQRLRPLLQRYGPHAIGVYYGNPLAFNSLGVVSLLGFLKSLGTRNVYGAASQDCQNKFVAAELIHQNPLCHPIPDLEHTHLAVMFGTNPLVSQASFFHLGGGARVFQDLLARGGDAVWIDPRRSESAARWGHHLPIRPGADAWLLLALLHKFRPASFDDPRAQGLRELLDLAAQLSPARICAETGLSQAQIDDLAARIRRAPSVAFHLSVGVNQGPFGTLCYVALQALAFLTGNLDKRGGSLFHPLAPWADRLRRLAGFGTTPRTSRIGGFSSVLDTLPGGILADEILTPGPEQIRAMIVIAGDPLSSIPGQDKLKRAFRNLEFSVCLDLFESETGRASDLILPTTSWLERGDVAITTAFLQTGSLLQTTSPVLPVPGDTRHESRILGDLLAAMGRRSWLSVFGRLGLERRFPSPTLGVWSPSPTPGAYLGTAAKPSRARLRFWSTSLERDGARLLSHTSPSEGLLLIGRRRRLGHNSWLHGGHRDGNSESFCSMHPDDMSTRGLRSGEAVELSTQGGRLKLPVRASSDLARGTVVVPHGLPGLSSNALLPSGTDHIEATSGQHIMTGIPVEVRALRAALRPEL